MLPRFWMISIVLAGVLILLGGYRHHLKTSPEHTDTRRILYYVDPMHPSYTSDKPGFAPDCGMPLEPVYADQGRDATRASGRPNALRAAAELVNIDPGVQQVLGISVVTVLESAGMRTVQVPGRVTADESRVHRVSVNVDGLVEATYDDTVGRHVAKNQRLAAIYSQDFLSAATAYLAAIEQTQDAASQGAAPTRALVGLKKNWYANLRSLGMGDPQIEELERTRKVPDLIYLASPIDGFILARNIAAGQRFERHTDFYRVADLREVWIVAELFGGEEQYLRPGALAHVKLRNQLTPLHARVADILPPIDPMTRASQVRLVADNRSLALRPDLLVSVELQLPAPSGLSVPADAVIDSGRSQRVYVSVAPGAFEARQVEVGERFGDRVQILRGLDSGEQVVASGTFLVDSESRMRSPARSESRTAAR